MFARVRQGGPQRRDTLDEVFGTHKPHGGGTIAYAGKNEIPAGIFSFKGPCPPSGQQHAYNKWTTKALDRSGKTIASTNAIEKNVRHGSRCVFFCCAPAPWFRLDSTHPAPAIRYRRHRFDRASALILS